MTRGVMQWDVVRVRINPADRDEHPAVVISSDEFCLDPHKRMVNVLYGTTRRPGLDPRAHEVVLNGADGLEHPTLFSCGHLYTIDRRKISATLGRVAPERRRQIGRKIVGTFRLPL
ncbi:MAG: PemK-like, MazF-like toxin of type toxin-antitoxin system [Verrucomicrobiota bacterium]|jgi:mRNA-degrading endonuclease toxin of MazEF toxin-antitoxin module